ncbi:MAG: hypothetical protein IJR66_03140 [Clostridia bacterium]|nr:hypothetical protein [Clostridia bacterium]
MRKKKEMIRISSMIENDRLYLTDNFSVLLSKDVERVLTDYFDGVSGIKLAIEKGNGCYISNITFNALRIKTFNSIPKS